MLREIGKMALIGLAGFLILVLVFIGGTELIDHIGRNLHGDLAFDDDYNLVCDKKTYYPMIEFDFTVRAEKKSEVSKLGWCYNFPFENIHYYAFEENSPLFIFCDSGSNLGVYSRGIYVREDYDINSALFTVKGTDIEILPTDALIESDVEPWEIDYPYDKSFDLCLNDDTRIQIHFTWPCKHNGKWYVVQDVNDRVYVLSDDFVAALKTCNVI